MLTTLTFSITQSDKLKKMGINSALLLSGNMKKTCRNSIILLLYGLSIYCSADDRASNNYLLVSNASIRAMPPGHSNTAAFLSISNLGDEDCKLLKADSPDVKRIEFHTHLYEKDMVKMRPLEFVELPASSSLLFESGGLHLMLIGVKPMLKNQSLTQINIHTDHCGTVSFNAVATDSIVNSGRGMNH